jgi:hypothetical protein
MQSVNAGIDSNDFPTAWGTFNDVAAMILSLPPGCKAATFDISAAYRITPVRPDQQNALCIVWRGRIYVDRAVMFGLTSSAGVFGAIADMLIAIYRAAGIRLILKWVDDFLVIRTAKETWTEEDFVELTSRIGVPWSAEKTRRFAVTQRYLGFNWDLEAKTVALPMEKLKAILSLMHCWGQDGAKFRAREAASLHGKLVHISSVYVLIRPFLCSVSVFALSFKSVGAKLHPPSSLRADLTWISFLLRSMPNRLPLATPELIDLGWWGDASTSFGIGVVVSGHWAVWRWAPGFAVGTLLEHDIGWAEAVAVELGLRLALHLHLVQGHLPRCCNFLVRSDNSGVVAILNKGRSRSKPTNLILKEVYLLQALNGLRVTAKHVPGRDNLSDALSRGDVAGFLKGFPSAIARASLPLPNHLAGKLIDW